MGNGQLFDDETLKAPEQDVGVEEKPGDPRLRTANRRQVQLRPCDLESLLEADHEARSLWTLLERLDLSAFYAKIRARGSAPGRAATDPKILLCLWTYATSQGVGSARRLACLCEEHDAYRWICGGVTVNHDMLAEFRVGCGAELDGVLTELLAVLLEGGLVTLRRVAHDGMRVRASAGAASFRREKTLQRCRYEARQQLAHVKKLVDEDPARSQERAAQERAAKDRQDRIERALKRMADMQKRQGKEARVSTTDPDAKVMKMPDGGYRPAYNVQLATDVDSRVVVGVSVTNVGSDAGLLLPMLDRVEERLAAPEELLVDGGFVKLQAIDAAENRGVTVYAPVPTPRKPDIDPHERKPNDTDATAAWRARMATDEAKEVYRDRAATAETTNADLRQHRGLTQFFVRGIPKVTTVALLVAFSYDMLRAISLGILG
jgi:transposase